VLGGGDVYCGIKLLFSRRDGRRRCTRLTDHDRDRGRSSGRARRVALAAAGEEGFGVLAEAGDVPTTERRLNAYRPRVVILDLTMPGESSLAAIPRMRETSPDTQIVVLTMHDDPAFARQALRAGAAGYVLKEAADTELVQAVRLAAEGRTYLSPQLGARLAAKSRAATGPPDDLSIREVEVLRLIAPATRTARSPRPSI
jgi:DNA-binding NarL/FixJ family response regulator